MHRFINMGRYLLQPCSGKGGTQTRPPLKQDLKLPFPKGGGSLKDVAVLTESCTQELLKTYRGDKG